MNNFTFFLLHFLPSLTFNFSLSLLFLFLHFLPSLTFNFSFLFLLFNRNICNISCGKSFMQRSFDSDSADIPLHDTGIYARASRESSCTICLRSYSTLLFLSSRSNRRTDLSPTRRNRNLHGGERKEEVTHPPTTVIVGNKLKSKTMRKKKKKFAWKIIGYSPCSKECGGGKNAIINRT